MSSRKPCQQLWHIQPNSNLIANRSTIIGRSVVLAHKALPTASALLPNAQLTTQCRLSNFSSSQGRIRRFSSCSPEAPEHPIPEWTPPADPTSRPVVIIGAGVLGRRLAVTWASTGRPVILHDISDEALSSAIVYIGDALTSVCAARDTHPGHVTTSMDLEASCCAAAADPWMVVEALPEDPETKRAILGRVDALVPRDCVIASTRSTWPTSALGTHVSRRERLLNTHYHHHLLPPRSNAHVELMTCSATGADLLPFLAEQMRSVGLAPLALPRESVGFVFDRTWAAARADALGVLQAGLASPRDVDALFRGVFNAEKGPCERMDEVGLDKVWAEERSRVVMGVVDPEKAGYLDWLEENYISKGRLGEKTGDGLYTADERRLLARKRALSKSSYLRLRM